MKTINRIFSQAFTAMRSRQVQLVIMVVAIALFVFAAGAPNATVGIGK